MGRRFAIQFALTAGVLLALYYYPYAPSTWMAEWLDRYLQGYAALAGTVLGFLEPAVQVIGRQISGRFSLYIVKTCDAMDVQILLLSAISAWPTSVKRRAVAAVVGFFAISLLNVARICSLYYVGVLRPQSFEFVHIELWPAVILLTVALGFFAWARRLSPSTLETSTLSSPTP